MVRSDNARALLPPVLECIETEVRKVGRIRVAEYPENPAFFFWYILIHDPSFKKRSSSPLTFYGDIPGAI
jgi:hypothetical protein